MQARARRRCARCRSRACRRRAPARGWSRGAGARVIDVAKAIASARGGSVCAVPTTLSGAEMSSGHRTLPGFEDRPRVRPALVLAEPRLMTSAPLARLAGECHERAGPCDGSPVRTEPKPRRDTRGAAGGVADRRGYRPPTDGGESLALGSILAGYALGATELSLHHVLCQTVVRVCATPHAATNAVMLPHTTAAIAGFAPDPMRALAEALGVSLPAPPGSDCGAGRRGRVAARARCRA